MKNPAFISSAASGRHIFKGFCLKASKPIQVEAFGQRVSSGSTLLGTAAVLLGVSAINGAAAGGKALASSPVQIQANKHRIGRTTFLLVFALLFASFRHTLGDCSAGTYLYAGTCLQCSPGTFSWAGASVCSLCAQGIYGSMSGATACSSAACSQLVQVGSTVMVLSSVSSPQFGWGAVTRSSVGTVISISGNRVSVNFPEQSGWSAAIGELQVVCAISGCTAGSYQPSGWTSCAVCSAGSYTSSSGSYGCIACPSGTYVSVQGRCLSRPIGV
jgi:hypothetical protein